MQRKSKDREERRNEFVGVAQKLFLEKGFDNTSVHDIVTTVGVAQGTFYYHFASKREIVCAVTEKIVSGTQKRLSEISNVGGLEPPKRLKRAITALFDDIHNNDEIIRQAYHEDNAVLHKKLFKSVLAAYVPLLANIIQQTTDPGLGRHPLETAEILIVLIEYYCRKYLHSGDRDHLRSLLHSFKPFLSPMLGEDTEPFIDDLQRSATARYVKEA